MIFQNLEQIAQLSPEKRLTKRGNTHKAPAPSRPFRSNMMLNPLRLHHLNRIDDLPADMITLNLEDAIAPSRKKEALYNIALFLSHLEQSNSFIIVRINPLDQGGIEEIEFLNNVKFDAIRIPKVTNQTEIQRVDKLLKGDREIHISLETKEAFNQLHQWDKISRFTTANLGILDLLSSLRLPQSLLTIDNPTIHQILSRFLLDAHSVGIHPISFMFQEYNNTQAFKAWCQLEKKMGFTTKACMGPKQVEIANEIFAPSKAEIQRARTIKEAFEASSKQAEHGFMDAQYGFIDEPIYRDALLILGEPLH